MLKAHAAEADGYKLAKAKDRKGKEPARFWIRQLRARFCVSFLRTNGEESCRVTSELATKTAHVTTNFHIPVYANARHSGKVTRALVQKAEQNETLRYRPRKLDPMMRHETSTRYK